MERDDLPQNQQSKFNSASDILQTISYHKYKAGECYSSGDLTGWFFEWKQIKFIIVGRLNSDDQKMYLKLEKKISFLIDNEVKSKEYKKLLIRLIEVYLTRLQMQIENWGMGTVNKEDEAHFA